MISQKIETLLGLKVAGYRAKGHMNPEVAGAYAVEDILNFIKNQPQYMEQLLDEEIEDARKAA